MNVEGPLPTAPLVSLALLKVNYDRAGYDYLDSFVALIAECLRRSAADVVAEGAIQQALHEHFGLDFPTPVVRTLLKRAERRGFLRRVVGTYRVNRDAVANSSFTKTQESILQAHDALVEGLVNYCSTTHGINWSQDEAAAALYAYLSRYYSFFLTGITSRTALPEVPQAAKGTNYLVGSYIRDLYTRSDPAAGLFESMVLGHMLANALYLPEPSQLQKKFSNTSVYLDTPLLMDALGYAEKTRVDAASELCRLMRRDGASLRCFEHTAQEMHNILHYYSQLRRQGRLETSAGARAPAARHFVSAGSSASDIELEAASLERHLQVIGVSVTAAAPYDDLSHAHVIDEPGLSERLQAVLRYRNEAARERDVASVAAIVRIRAGHRSQQVETCRALFVSPNTALVKTANAFVLGDDPTADAPPCLTDAALVNLMWLKEPTRAPELPRRRIISDAYAAVEPTEQLVMAFIEEVDRLRERGRVTADDYYELRVALDSDRALMEVTLGEPEALTEGTVEEILERIRVRREAGLRAELAEVRQVLSTAEAAELTRQEAVQARAKRAAARFRRALTPVAILIVLGAVAATATVGVGNPGTSVWRWVLLAVEALFFIGATVNYYSGTLIEDILDRLERRCYLWAYRVFEGGDPPPD